MQAGGGRQTEGPQARGLPQAPDAGPEGITRRRPLGRQRPGGYASRAIACKRSAHAYTVARNGCHVPVARSLSRSGAGRKGRLRDPGCRRKTTWPGCATIPSSCAGSTEGAAPRTARIFDHDVEQGLPWFWFLTGRPGSSSVAPRSGFRRLGRVGFRTLRPRPCFWAGEQVRPRFDRPGCPRRLYLWLSIQGSRLVFGGVALRLGVLGKEATERTGTEEITRQRSRCRTPFDVVHVVRDTVLRAPQKTHAPLTTTVKSGLLPSAENADHAP